MTDAASTPPGGQPRAVVPLILAALLAIGAAMRLIPW